MQRPEEEAATMTSEEPRTEAGRALLEWAETAHKGQDQLRIWRDHILAIEAEGLGLSDEQTELLRDHLASRQQTVGEFLGDMLMDIGLGRATGKDYPPGLEGTDR